MAWTVPRTWVAKETLTFSLLNTHLRDNMNETEAAKATGGGLFFGAALNSIVERRASYGQTLSSTNTASTTYTGVAPSRTVNTSDRALVLWSADFQNDTANVNTWSSIALTGATTIAATDDYSIVNSSTAANRNNQHMQHHFFNALTPGNNTFTMQYRVTSGASTGTWSNRRLLVIPM
jgi:hypothetical protein